MPAKRWLLIVLVFVLFLGMTQTGSAQPRGWERFFEESLDYYVQFGLENGMNVSWAHRYKEDYFLRYGADFRIDERSDDNKFTYPDTTTFSSTTTDVYSVTLHADFIKPVKPYEAVRLYVGAGPFVGIYWSNRETVEPVSPDLGLPNPEYTTEFTQQRYGLRGLVGGEYALNSRLSFFAEASVDLYAAFEKRERSVEEAVSDNPGYHIETTKVLNESQSFGLDMSSVRIGVTLRYGKEK